MELVKILAVVLFLSLPESKGQEQQLVLHQLLLDQISPAARLYFSRNPRLDGSGFNTIEEDQDWSATDLFRQQYGIDATTARFVAALLDFQYFKRKAVTFSDVTQLAMVGEFRDARQAFAAFIEAAVAHLTDENGVIVDIDAAIAIIDSSFRSLYDVVGGDNYASFLNLELGSSLSFVMDTTGSMGEDIAAAKERVVEIIQRTNGTNSAPLNYVLMPYNDPEYGPLTKTTDPIEFIDAVNALSASGGGDLPELAMIGILKAAQSSGFRSIVYVFTDAAAKDLVLRDNVIALCLTKKIAVFVFLTLDIDTASRQVYDDIARSTGGNVLYVPKDDIAAATAIMDGTTIQGLVTLQASSSNLTSFSINVDSTISSLIVQFIGDFSYLNFEGPQGTNAVSLASISGAELFRIDDVKEGVYTFNFDESVVNEYGVLIRGESGLGFHAKLQQVDSESGELASSQQFFAGRSTRAEMTIYGDDEDAEFKRFQLVARDGSILIEMGLEKRGDKFYVAEEDFILPVQPSVVRLTGTYDQMPIVRIDPCAITPTVSSAILKDIADVTVKAGETIQVTTELRNTGDFDEFSIVVSDNQDFVEIVGASSSSLTANLNTNVNQTITLDITVPAGTSSGILSKVVLSVTASNGNYFIFTTFVISVIDDVIRCPSPTTPRGGRLMCEPDPRSVGSNCTLVCGDEYVLEGANKISCQADGTWNPQLPGHCRFLGSQTCSVNGDPHYTTFDGLRYDFQGSCLYTVVQTMPDALVEAITIQVENGLFYDRFHVSWFKQAFITIFGITIHLKQGRIVLIDGVQITLPRFLEGGRIQILYDGGDVLIKTDFKLEVRLNSRHSFRVSLPASYSNTIYGLCGNYDGMQDNDLQVGNVTFTAPSAFGNSLEIVGGSQPWCRRGTLEDDESGCNEAQRALFSEKCSALKSTCFQDCADNVTVDAIFKDCVFDMCALGGNDAIYEASVSNFARFCSERRIQICNWREEFGFPTPTCGRNQHYEFRGNRCPNTCVDPQAARRCTSKPKVEGCVCNDGFVLDGTKCVRLSECGCADSGAYYENGFTFIEQDCGQQCTCSDGLLNCVPYSCDEGTVCGIVSAQQYGCVVERTDQCYATGDPHYKTLDGSRYDFMGVCRYAMLSTEGTEFTDTNRHITITAQNEHRGLRTAVSYVRSVTIELAGNVSVQLGPRNSYEVRTPMNASSDLISVEQRGWQSIAKTKFGVTVKFDGTNLYIDVPNFYMNKVSGLCGNYTGNADDDFGGMSLGDFTSANLYSDGCNADETIPDPFVCSPEATAKWAGPEYCGRMNASTGPLSFCLPFVDINSIMENCVFDACATDGETINSSFRVLAEECKDHKPCDWEVQLGIAPACPANSQYICGPACQNSCENPEASAQCDSADEFAQCICIPGYILHKGECVKASSCGCVLEDGSYVEQGYSGMTAFCKYSISCTGPGSVTIVDDPCDENTKCLEVQDGEFQCVPNELSYALVYGAIHFKTFDNHYFDFRTNCAYLLAGHDSDNPMIPSFRVYIVNKMTPDGKMAIDQVIIEGTIRRTQKFIIRVERDLTYMVDGIRYPVGATIDGLTVNWRRGNLALISEFAEVHYNGRNWVRVDVADVLANKMHGMGGNYNRDQYDDLVDDGVMLTPDAWGNIWTKEVGKSLKCSKPTPPMDLTCHLRSRYERSCFCGLIRDEDGPFAACHASIDPKPFMNACVSDACYSGGSFMAMIDIMKAYRLACLGRGILIRFQAFTETALEEAFCPENSHFSNCTGQSQPTCASPRPSYLTQGCEEGCVCNDGFIMSNNKCVPKEKCGCMSEDGIYYEHGTCRTNTVCTETCNCVYGEWNCEQIKCNREQACMVLDGVHGCHWKDPCKHDNGGCSDRCGHDDDYNVACSCDSGRILTKDNKTCVEISMTFFEDGVQPDSCGVAFSAWKNEYKNWQDVYVPRWRKELNEYQDYVNKGIVSAGIDVCHYEWTAWYDRDDPEGCGDDESLELLRSENPDICQNPIAGQARLANGRELRSINARFEVTKRGVMCRNAEQDRGIVCPDLAVRFLCRVPVVVDKPSCE